MPRSSRSVTSRNTGLVACRYEPQATEPTEAPVSPAPMSVNAPASLRYTLDTSPVPADPALWPYQQHAPELESQDGDRFRFLVFDNATVRVGADGNPREDEPYSRVAEFVLDESTMLAMPS